MLTRSCDSWIGIAHRSEGDDRNRTLVLHWDNAVYRHQIRGLDNHPDNAEPQPAEEGDDAEGDDDNEDADKAKDEAAAKEEEHAREADGGADRHAKDVGGDASSEKGGRGKRTVGGGENTRKFFLGDRKNKNAENEKRRNKKRKTL